MVRVYVETELRYTESYEKVVQAIRNIFDLEEIRLEQGGRFPRVVGVSQNIASLKRFRERIWVQRILDTARGILLRGVSGNTITFLLHKQAAFTGRVSFIEDERESSLGPIRVVIETSNPQELIDWLAPRTSQGRPLWVKEMPENL